jgi:hypothetical protein
MRLVGCLASVVALALSSPALAAPTPWSADFPTAATDVEEGHPLVIYVVVPLCSNDQIDCGSAAAGRPGDLGTNLYWGAGFGARRFFERKASPWERVERKAGEGSTLERAVYRRRAPGSAWGKEGTVEQLVVLEAVHGTEIDRGVLRFWSLATEGGRVTFQDGGRERDERIHVVGYAGHDRLMDGLKLPAAKKGARSPIPSFVFACYSERYFGDSLRAAGSRPLVTTRALMAPEGYIIDAIARGLGDGLARGAVREGVVREYAKWQRLSFGTASSMFSP